MIKRVFLYSFLFYLLILVLFIVHDKIARMIHFNRTATDSEYARIERWMDSKHKFADAVDKDTP